MCRRVSILRRNALLRICGLSAYILLSIDRNTSLSQKKCIPGMDHVPGMSKNVPLRFFLGNAHDKAVDVDLRFDLAR